MRVTAYFRAATFGVVARLIAAIVLYFGFINFPKVDRVRFETGENDGFDKFGISGNGVERIHGVSAGGVCAAVVQTSIKSRRSPAAANASA